MRERHAQRGERGPQGDGAQGVEIGLQGRRRHAPTVCVLQGTPSSCSTGISSRCDGCGGRGGHAQPCFGVTGLFAACSASASRRKAPSMLKEIGTPWRSPPLPPACRWPAAAARGPGAVGAATRWHPGPAHRGSARGELAGAEVHTPGQVGHGDFLVPFARCPLLQPLPVNGTPAGAGEAERACQWAGCARAKGVPVPPARPPAAAPVHGPAARGPLLQCMGQVLRQRVCVGRWCGRALQALRPAGLGAVQHQA